MAGVMYDLVILFWRVIINIFFREIRPRGTFNIPRTGPVIFVGAPHHNQFLDPLLLSSEVRRECPRRVSSLAAAASIKRRFVGAFIRMLDSIPVTRAADLAKMGIGKIYIEEDDPTRVIGVGTKFVKQCMIKGQLVLPKHVGYAQGEIAEIISDTEIRLSREFITAGKGGASDVRATSRVVSEGQSARAQGEPGLAYKALPYVDQHEVYGHVYKRLNENGTIGIFPEGGSHDRPDLLPLKAGVSVMALGAMSQNKNLEINIVPCGLSYFHPHKFRSRAVVEFGTPIKVPRELVKLFDQGGAAKREGCGKLLEMIHDGLKAVTIRTPDPETLMVIHAGRRLYKSPGQQWTLGQVVELTKRFIEAYQVYRDEPRVSALTEKIRNYNRKLRDLGLKDHQVERATTQRKLRNLLLLVYRSGLLLAWAILALPGVITHAPIFIPAKIYSKKKAKEALAASTVKIAARDVIATWKILFSMAATPSLYIIYAILATWLAWRNGAPSGLVKSMPVLIFIIMPFFAMSSLKFGEAGMDVFKSLRPLFLSLLPGSQKELEKLRRKRESLANELSELINEFGPKLWVNFHQSSLRPAASAPQTGENPGLMYRKGETADSSMLAHPMLWLDERIFGWSRSAAKGPNVWNAKPRSEFGSPPLSPTESDTEEVGGADVDYDDVLAIIDTRRSRTGVREKTGTSSYSSRKQTMPGGSSDLLDQDQGDNETVRKRKPRTRSTSLDHSVPAKELRAATRQGHDATFASISSELNNNDATTTTTDPAKGNKAA